MNGSEVIENGDILVRTTASRRSARRGKVQIPSGARTIDVTGKTIMPGLVDVHAHIWPAWNIHKTQVWEYLANLAYGVTTTRDPQTATTDILAYRDLVETGQMIGPRVFGTGPGVFSQDNVQSLDEARDVLKRYSQYWDTKTIKQYMAGNRQQRQWIIMAAKEQKLMPTLEGGLDLKLNLTQIIDGYPGLEHTLPIMPLYKDVVQLVAQSGIVYTPTLLVQYGGPWAENYFYESTDVHGDTKMRRFTPHRDLDGTVLRRPWFHEQEYSFPLAAKVLADIVAAGGKIGLGGHGQRQGIQCHWELWAIASGGMTNHDVLRVGTIFGAEAHRDGEGSRLARKGQARRPGRPRQEPAREHPQHEHGPLRDEERRDLRGRYAGSGLAAAEEAAAPVLVGSRALDAEDRAGAADDPDAHAADERKVEAGLGQEASDRVASSLRFTVSGVARSGVEDVGKLSRG